MKYGLLFAILLLFATGCGQGDPARHPMMLKGDQYRKEGNFELAEKFYLKFVEQRPDSALGHRTLATLYDESLADPAAALFQGAMLLRRGHAAARPDPRGAADAAGRRAGDAPERK